ncbi:UDP-N-acetylmuramate--L-alanine ligase [Patescibacteria group bacterium]
MKKLTYYLIGIGGISMSAIALYLHKNGNKVLGSDIQQNQQTKELQQKGIKIYFKQDALNINSDIDIIVYTSAVENIDSKGYSELLKARKLKIKTYKRSEFLGKLFNHKRLIAIAGTHGKTTTTGMIAKILNDNKIDPTVLIGATVKEFKNRNIKMGKSDIVLLEACEYDRSFLDLNPDIVVITNIEEEHLDYFKGGLPEIFDTFSEFIKRIKSNGTLIIHQDKNTQKVISKINRKDIKVVPYAQKINSDIVNKIQLNIPGTHNIDNALATYFVGKVLNIKDNNIHLSLNKFNGTGRRSELIYQDNGIKLFDDYAHHPTEIKTTLLGFKQKYKKNKIICIFQPHQYSRTKILFHELAKSFKDCDELILLPIYSVVGREEKKDTSSKKLADEIRKYHSNVTYKSNFIDTQNYLLGKLSKDDIVISMGAGDINKFSLNLKEKLSGK